jgi:hypothetical protein
LTVVGLIAGINGSAFGGLFLPGIIVFIAGRFLPR